MQSINEEPRQEQICFSRDFTVSRDRGYSRRGESWPDRVAQAGSQLAIQFDGMISLNFAQNLADDRDQGTRIHPNSKNIFERLARDSSTGKEKLLILNFPRAPIWVSKSSHGMLIISAIILRHLKRGCQGMNWQEQVVLVTGGTGSFGKKFLEVMLSDYHPQKLIIFSRDEVKQHDMRTAGLDHPSLRYFIGDVRDPQRLQRAFSGVTLVVHAAALKQVPACEYNPFEAVQTNIMGGRNVIDAAIDRGVRRVLALSSDKAVNPINLYGATKLCAEKMFVQANAHAGAQDTRFSCARYGNVVGSRAA
jgi:NADP-dependent 3-hydroxy acid dehydrogenase YdfG